MFNQLNVSIISIIIKMEDCMTVYLLVFALSAELQDLLGKYFHAWLAIIFPFTYQELHFRNIKIINLQRNPEHKHTSWEYLKFYCYQCHRSTPPPFSGNTIPQCFLKSVEITSEEKFLNSKLILDTFKVSVTGLDST